MLIRPLLPELRNIKHTVVQNLLCSKTLLLDTLFETAPEPVTKIRNHFICNSGSMAVDQPKSALTLGIGCHKYE